MKTCKRKKKDGSFQIGDKVYVCYDYESDKWAGQTGTITAWNDPFWNITLDNPVDITGDGFLALTGGFSPKNLRHLEHKKIAKKLPV